MDEKTKAEIEHYLAGNDTKLTPEVTRWIDVLHASNRSVNFDHLVMVCRFDNWRRLKEKEKQQRILDDKVRNKENGSI